MSTPKRHSLKVLRRAGTAVQNFGFTDAAKRVVEQFGKWELVFRDAYSRLNVPR